MAPTWRGVADEPGFRGLGRRTRDLSASVFGVISAAAGGLVGAVMAVATSGAVPWYWGALAVVYAATLWKLVETDRDLRELRARQAAKLRIVFISDERPYLQEVTVWQELEPQMERRYRIGIQNDSDQPISGARVVLEHCDPVEGDMLLPDYPLAAMSSDRRDGVFTVHPGDRPTAFVDVVYDLSPTDGPRGDWIFICYADQNLPSMLPPSSNRFTLRVEGGGASARKKFVVEKTLETGRLLVMKEIESVTPNRVIV